MSGWIDFVPADRSDAERIADLPDPKKVWPGTVYKYLPPAGLVPLIGILAGGEGPAASEAELEQLIMDDRAWVFAFPDRLVRMLASLRKKDVPRVAAAWRAASAQPGSDEQLTRFLIELCAVARRATAEGKLVIARHGWDG